MKSEKVDKRAHRDDCWLAVVCRFEGWRSELGLTAWLALAAVIICCCCSHGSQPGALEHGKRQLGAWLGRAWRAVVQTPSLLSCFVHSVQLVIGGLPGGAGQQGVGGLGSCFPASATA